MLSHYQYHPFVQTQIHTHKFWYTCILYIVHVLVFVLVNVVLIWTHMAFSIRLRFSDFRFHISVQICNLLSIVNWKTFRSQLFNNNTELHYYCRDINWLFSLHICFFFSPINISSFFASLSPFVPSLFPALSGRILCWRHLVVLVQLTLD